MFGSLARLALIVTGLAVVIPDTAAHDHWISRGGHRNAAGEWCCGAGDCLVVTDVHTVSLPGPGYRLPGGEFVPQAQAQPSPDSRFWCCRRPDGSRRCFFAPPPNS
jgi:hypothetical protein